MRTPLVDGKQPGQFRARCNLTVAKPDKKLTPEERREAQTNGYRRRLDTNSRPHRWFVHFPQCQGFETDDLAAFAEHMAVMHNKKTVKGEGETLAASIRKGWRYPAPGMGLKDDGKPFKPSTVEIERTSATCPPCGLVAEVGYRTSDVLWWDEHLHGCALASATDPQAGAA